MKTPATDNALLNRAESHPVVVEGGAQIAIARLMALKQAVRLEATGMRHSSGKSMRRVACRELGMRANTKHDDVIGALTKEIDKRIRQLRKPVCPNCGLSEFMGPTLPRDHHTHVCGNCCVHSSPLGPKQVQS
jgi:hypothetical protein